MYRNIPISENGWKFSKISIVGSCESLYICTHNTCWCACLSRQRVNKAFIWVIE